jgi:cytosine/adenosine deaminase-related metal-dependent hydrolase
LNELAESDFDLLLGAKPNFHIIHCPRSHEYFGHSPFQFEKLCQLGFNICLGTDSLASNDDLNLFAEMRAFRKEFPNISPEEVLNMVTVNSAHALRQEDALGKIRSDYLADLIAVPCTRHGESVQGRTRSTSVFDEIVSFDRGVSWSMIGGQVQNSA